MTLCGWQDIYTYIHELTNLVINEGLHNRNWCFVSQNYLITSVFSSSVVESRPTNNGHQAGSFTKTPSSHQIYVHVSISQSVSSSWAILSKCLGARELWSRSGHRRLVQDGFANHEWNVNYASLKIGLLVSCSWATLDLGTFSLPFNSQRNTALPPTYPVFLSQFCCPFFGGGGGEGVQWWWVMGVGVEVTSNSILCVSSICCGNGNWKLLGCVGL